MKLSP